MQADADSVYDRSHPWQSLPERLVTESLAVADIPGDVLALQSAPPPVVRPLFPPKYGYRTTALGVQDALQVNSLYPAPTNGVGSIGGYSGTSRPTIGGF
jgi:hypothetical protein